MVFSQQCGEVAVNWQDLGRIRKLVLLFYNLYIYKGNMVLPIGIDIHRYTFIGIDMCIPMNYAYICFDAFKQLSEIPSFPSSELKSSSLGFFKDQLALELVSKKQMAVKARSRSQSLKVAESPKHQSTFNINIIN